MCYGMKELRNILASTFHFAADRTQFHRECDCVLKNKFGNIVFKYPEKNINVICIIFQGRELINSYLIIKS